MQYLPLITTADILHDLKLEAGTYAGTVERWIAWISDAIQHQAGQPIAAAAIDYEFIGDGTESEFLEFWPVRTLDALQVRAFDSSTWNTLTGGTIITARGVTQIRHPGGFGGDSVYRATLTVGYESGKIPGDILKVAHEAVTVALRGTSAEGVGEGRVGIDTITQAATKIDGLTVARKVLNMEPKWTAVIDRYKLMVRP